MLIRKIIIIFSVGLLFGALNIYFFKYISPYKIEKLEELIQNNQIEDTEANKFDEELDLIKESGAIFSYLSSNAYVGATIFIFTITFLFAALHIIIDKLFFRKFFEQPSMFNAFRRGFLVGLGVVFFIILNLLRLGLLEKLLLIIILVLVEIIFKNYLQKDLTKLIKKAKNKIENIKIAVEKNSK